MQELTSDDQVPYFFRAPEKTLAIHLCVKAIANVMRPLEQVFGREGRQRSKGYI
jgi:hypothetical protein